MLSKYLVFATMFLLVLSSTANVYAASATVLTKTGIDTHGPRVSTVVFSSNAADSGLLGCLSTPPTSSGNCQAVEWTLTAGSWLSMSCTTSTDCYKSKATTYETDGLAFNAVMPYWNNPDVRLAVQYLINYKLVGTAVCGNSLACTATPAVLPCALYSPACYAPTLPAFSISSLVAAANLLLMGGLVAKVTVPSAPHGYYYYCINFNSTGTSRTFPEPATGSGCQWTPTTWDKDYPNAPLNWLTSEAGFGTITYKNYKLPTFVGFFNATMLANCYPVQSILCPLGTTGSSWYPHTLLESGVTTANDGLTYGYSTSPNSYAAGGNTTYANPLYCPNQVSTWYTSLETGCAEWTPTVYYRSDDPLRSTLYVNILGPDAKYIGFDLNAGMSGISGDEADSVVYGNTAPAILIPGEYDPAQTFTCIEPQAFPSIKLTTSVCTGDNDAPMYNATYVNGSSTSPWSSASPDAWGIYSYGWVLSASYEAQGELWNSMFVPSPNFGNFYSQQMDHDQDGIFYADHVTPVKTDNCENVPGDELITDSCSAVEAAWMMGYSFQKYVPYVIGFWENSLWAVETSGWAGYANVAGDGPGTMMGISYTLLNACYVPSYTGLSPNCQGDKNNAFEYVTHEGVSSLNPLYYSPWVWQEDLWGEYFEGALGTAPVCATTVNVFIDWMITNPMTPGSTKGCAPNALTLDSPTTQIFNGKTPAPANGWQWTSFQTCNGVLAIYGSCYPGTPGYFQGENIVLGTNVTFIFRNNITWSDGYPFNAADYNFSLFAWDVAVNPTTPSLYTPDYCALCGPSGIMADAIRNITSGVYAGDSEIQVIINSSAVWNTGAASVSALPWHIWKYFNLDAVSQYPAGAMDTSVPMQTALYTCSWEPSSFCGNSLTPPAWIDALPTIEIGTGPFFLGCANPTASPPVCVLNQGVPSGQAGTMYANLNYYRTAWKVNATDFTYETGVTSIPLGAEEPGTITLSPVSETGNSGYTTSGVTVSSAEVSQVCLSGCGTMVFKAVSKGVTTEIPSTKSYTIPECSATSTPYGMCWSTSNVAPSSALTVAANIPTGTLYLYTCAVKTGCAWSALTPDKWANGMYEVVIDASYTFNGSPTLTWQQFTGFQISSSVIKVPAFSGGSSGSTSATSCTWTAFSGGFYCATAPGSEAPGFLLNP